MTADVLGQVERALVEAYGERPSRASTSFVGVDPIEVLRFGSDPISSYVTLGMSRRPMTAADSFDLDGDGPRAELLVQTRGDGGQLWRRLAVLGAAPAVEGVVYLEGMTADLGVPLTAGSRCTGVLIAASALAAVVTPSGPVHIYRALPATSAELAWARVHGATALRERWEQHATELLDLRRIGVDLN